MGSISSRLLVTTSLVLTVCLGSIGFVLEDNYEEAAKKALKDRLHNQLYSIIAAVDLGSNGRMFMPQNLPEARFSTEGSGLYAQIVSHDESQHWQSASSRGVDIPYKEKLDQGDVSFQITRASNREEVYAINMGLSWEVRNKVEAFTFSVAENLFEFRQQITSYRKNLWTWLVGVGVIFLFIQAIILRVSLAPLRKVADDLAAIEQGKKNQLEGIYPKEIDGLTTNLNAFIRSEREQIARYRNSLSDLAHSLKTPLAVIQNEIESPSSSRSMKSTLSDQVERIGQLVDYQLQKAASIGRTALAAPISMDTLTNRIVNSLKKVYIDKNIKVHMDISPDAIFNGDKGDILEILGNVIDNAYKWANSYIHIEIALSKDVKSKDKKLQMLSILVEDDGPGIPEAKAREVLQRGVRADEHVQGHGIGLAVVRDLVHLYNGKLELNKARFGGARVKLTLYT